MTPRTWLVTGGLGFIGSAFIRLVLAERPDVRLVNLDAMTYAANPANLAAVDGDPRYRRSGGGARGDRRRRRGDRELRGGDARRPLDPRSRGVLADRYPRDARPPRSGQRVGRSPLPPSLDRRSLRRRPGRRIVRDRPARTAIAVCGEQGRRRPSSPRLFHDLRYAGPHHARFEYLRPLSISREAHPALRDQPDRRRDGPRLRRRNAAARLAARRRSRARHLARPRTRAGRRRLQPRRREPPPEPRDHQAFGGVLRARLRAARPLRARSPRT